MVARDVMAQFPSNNIVVMLFDARPQKRQEEAERGCLMRRRRMRQAGAKGVGDVGLG